MKKLLVLVLLGSTGFLLASSSTTSVDADKLAEKKALIKKLRGFTKKPESITVESLKDFHTLADFDWPQENISPTHDKKTVLGVLIENKKEEEVLFALLCVKEITQETREKIDSSDNDRIKEALKETTFRVNIINILSEIDLATLGMYQNLSSDKTVSPRLGSLGKIFPLDTIIFYPSQAADPMVLRDYVHNQLDSPYQGVVFAYCAPFYEAPGLALEDFLKAVDTANPEVGDFIPQWKKLMEKFAHRFQRGGVGDLEFLQCTDDESWYTRLLYFHNQGKNREIQRLASVILDDLGKYSRDPLPAPAGPLVKVSTHEQLVQCIIRYVSAGENMVLDSIRVYINSLDEAVAVKDLPVKGFSSTSVPGIERFLDLINISDDAELARRNIQIWELIPYKAAVRPEAARGVEITKKLLAGVLENNELFPLARAYYAKFPVNCSDITFRTSTVAGFIKGNPSHEGVKLLKTIAGLAVDKRAADSSDEKGATTSSWTAGAKFIGAFVFLGGCYMVYARVTDAPKKSEAVDTQKKDAAVPQ